VRIKMDEKKDYEEIQLSNIFIKEHILDIIQKINQCEIIARVGSSDLISLLQMDENEKTKVRLNAMDLMEAYINTLKGNVHSIIIKKSLLIILLLLKNLNQEKQICDYSKEDHMNNESYTLNFNFFLRLDQLTKIKEKLINACAEKGFILPTKDDKLETKTEIELEEDDEEVEEDLEEKEKKEEDDEEVEEDLEEKEKKEEDDDE
jgi:hypothetical protein